MVVKVDRQSIEIIIMKKTVITLIFLIASCQVIFSQEDEVSEAGEWFIQNYFGIATIESNDLFKVNANSYGISLGKEFIVSKYFSIKPALDYQRISFDTNISNNQLYYNNDYLRLPVLARINSNVKSKTNFYVETGFYISYLFSVQVENFQENIENSTNSLGSNFGIQAGFGVKHQFTENLSMNLGFLTQTDTFEILSDDEIQLIEIKNLYAFNIGVGFKF